MCYNQRKKNKNGNLYEVFDNEVKFILKFKLNVFFYLSL